jgi:two-component system LytT family response regulator
MRYAYVIVEDEPLQLKNLSEMLQRRPDLYPLGEFSNTQQCFEFLSSNPANGPDLLFLDLNLPREGDGFGLLDSIEGLPLHHRTIIFTHQITAAPEGYFYNSVSGFLTKPVEQSKLNKAIEKALRELPVKSQAPVEYLEKSPPKSPHPTIRIKHEGMSILFQTKDLVYLEAQGNNVIFMDKDGKDYKTRGPLKDWYEKLDKEDFLRVHDSYVINFNFISGFSSHFSQLKFKKSVKHCPIGRTYLRDFKKKMMEMGLSADEDINSDETGD